MTETVRVTQPEQTRVLVLNRILAEPGPKCWSSLLAVSTIRSMRRRQVSDSRRSLMPAPVRLRLLVHNLDRTAINGSSGLRGASPAGPATMLEHASISEDGASRRGQGTAGPRRSLVTGVTGVGRCHHAAATRIMLTSKHNGAILALPQVQRTDHNRSQACGH
jgi:hypothetical protein